MDFKYLSISQYSKQAGTSKASIYDWIKEGRIKAKYHKQARMLVIDIFKYPVEEFKPRKRGRKSFDGWNQNNGISEK